MKKGKERNIIVYTDTNVYFIKADGYMSGEVLKKFNANDDISDFIRRFNDGNYTKGRASDRWIEDIRVFGGRNNRDIVDTSGVNGEDGSLYGLDGGEQNGNTGGIGTESAVDKIKRSKQTDAEYMDAVERGDMETAQRMVDEAA